MYILIVGSESHSMSGEEGCESTARISDRRLHLGMIAVLHILIVQNHQYIFKSRERLPILSNSVLTV